MEILLVSVLAAFLEFTANGFFFHKFSSHSNFKNISAKPSVILSTDNGWTDYKEVSCRFY